MNLLSSGTVVQPLEEVDLVLSDEKNDSAEVPVHGKVWKSLPKRVGVGDIRT